MTASAWSSWDSHQPGNLAGPCLSPAPFLAWRSHNAAPVSCHLPAHRPFAACAVAAVATGEGHLQELMLAHAVPPPAPPGSSTVSLVRMGFPSKNPEAPGTAAFCGEAQGVAVCQRRWRLLFGWEGRRQAGVGTGRVWAPAALPWRGCSGRGLPWPLRLPGRPLCCRRGVPAAAGGLHLPQVQGAGGGASQPVPRVRAVAGGLPAPGPLLPPPLPGQSLWRGGKGGAGGSHGEAG